MAFGDGGEHFVAVAGSSGSGPLGAHGPVRAAVYTANPSDAEYTFALVACPAVEGALQNIYNTFTRLDLNVLNSWLDVHAEDPGRGRAGAGGRVDDVCVCAFQAVNGALGQQHPSEKLGRLGRAIAESVASGEGAEAMPGNACDPFARQAEGKQESDLSAERLREVLDARMTLRARLAAPLVRLCQAEALGGGSTVESMVRVARKRASQASALDDPHCGADVAPPRSQRGTASAEAVVSVAGNVNVWNGPSQISSVAPFSRSPVRSCEAERGAVGGGKAREECASEAGGGASSQQPALTIVHFKTINRASLMLDVCKALSSQCVEVLRALATTRENMALDTFEVCDGRTREPLSFEAREALADALDSALCGRSVPTGGDLGNAAAAGHSTDTGLARSRSHQRVQLLGRMLSSPLDHAISNALEAAYLAEGEGELSHADERARRGTSVTSSQSNRSPALSTSARKDGSTTDSPALSTSSSRKGRISADSISDAGIEQLLRCARVCAHVCARLLQAALPSPCVRARLRMSLTSLMHACELPTSQNGTSAVTAPRARYRRSSFDRVPSSQSPTSDSGTGTPRDADSVSVEGAGTGVARVSMMPRQGVKRRPSLAPTNAQRREAGVRTQKHVAADAGTGQVPPEAETSPPPAHVQRLLAESATRLLSTLGVVSASDKSSSADALKLSLARRMSMRCYEADEPILQRGDAVSEWTVVVKGEVSMLLGSSTLTPVVLGPGDSFGELALLHDHVSNSPILSLGSNPKPMSRGVSRNDASNGAAPGGQESPQGHAVGGGSPANVTDGPAAMAAPSALGSGAAEVVLAAGKEQGPGPVIAYALAQSDYQEALAAYYVALDGEMRDALLRVAGLASSLQTRSSKLQRSVWTDKGKGALNALAAALLGERMVTVEGGEIASQCRPELVYVVVRGALLSYRLSAAGLSGSKDAPRILMRRCSVGSMVCTSPLGVKRLLGMGELGDGAATDTHDLEYVAVPEGCRLVPLRACIVSEALGDGAPFGAWRKALEALLKKLQGVTTAMPGLATASSGDTPRGVGNGSHTASASHSPSDLDSLKESVDFPESPFGSSSDSTPRSSWIAKLLPACCGPPTPPGDDGRAGPARGGGGGRSALYSVRGPDNGAGSTASALLRNNWSRPVSWLRGKYARPLALDAFNIGACIGKGMTGRVYLATHRPTGKQCALKVVVKARMLQMDEVDHILAEGDLLARLRSRFVVPLLGAFQDEHALYMAFEYAPGGDMWHHVYRRMKAGRGPLSKDEARYYLAQTVLALESVHEAGAVYRDVKPENLLLTADGNLLLADMGFAKVLGPGERTTTICGTPDYLPPEIISSRGCTRACDLWSLGVLVYEMLCGRAPFKSPTTLQTYTKIAEVGKRGFFQPARWPSAIGATARDLITRLLRANENTRLGMGARGFADVKAHPFFAAIKWRELEAGDLVAPLRPDDAHRAATSGAKKPPGGHGGAYAWQTEVNRLRPGSPEDLMFAGFPSVNRFHEVARS